MRRNIKKIYTQAKALGLLFQEEVRENGYDKALSILSEADKESWRTINEKNPSMEYNEITQG